jgi:hypothetical protein
LPILSTFVSLLLTPLASQPYLIPWLTSTSSILSVSDATSSMLYLVGSAYFPHYRPSASITIPSKALGRPWSSPYLPKFP